jgi:hypothetical protein
VVLLLLAGMGLGVLTLVGAVYATTRFPAFGVALKGWLGQDGPDPAVDTKAILSAAADLKRRLDEDQPVHALNFVVWKPKANLGFGEHAGLELKFGLDAARVAFLVDIGRRPADASKPALSVLRVYDEATFLRYSEGVPTHHEDISDLCPSRSGQRLGYRVLEDLRPLLESPDAPPVEWNFHILFNNCARYAQERIGEVVLDDGLRERVLTFRRGTLISPSELWEHLAVCNTMARLERLRRPPTPAERTHLLRYLEGLPLDEKGAWGRYLFANPAFRSGVLDGGLRDRFDAWKVDVERIREKFPTDR